MVLVVLFSLFSHPEINLGRFCPDGIVKCAEFGPRKPSCTDGRGQVSQERKPATQAIALITDNKLPLSPVSFFFQGILDICCIYILCSSLPFFFLLATRIAIPGNCSEKGKEDKSEEC